ncbi:hypothetical protein KK062_23560 [Fulvivirgaceae bacterium PWU5]|uniref:Uncharacterized protein n=1 Tax=Dawidia cretensis TaxID=2782350 RepID=A0AAP2E407_9BACT|nr:hypothetical protein [Dawidia cretensis]MBT1711242.1 hypothetical protein [Dawidia cretensis]
MKIYSRILGILGFLIVISSAITAAYFLNFENIDMESRVGLSISFIPIYIFGHFIILHRFGFHHNAEYSDIQKRKILGTSLSLFGLLVAISLLQIINQLQVEKLRTWPEDSIAYGFTGELKTKYIEKDLYCQLTITRKQPFSRDSLEFIINLLDSDGFLITSIEPENYTRILSENKKTYAIESKFTSNALAYNSRGYNSIRKWSLAFRIKK